MDLALLGTSNLNVLPLSMSAIDRVAVYSHPVLIAGVFAPAGALHIHTTPPARGYSAQGQFSAANQVNDPGPYRYTRFASPNIDRIGPTYEAALALADSAGHLRAHLGMDQHHATDERIETRVRTLYQGTASPRLLLAKAGGDATLHRLGRHRMYGGHARLQDLRFIEAIGLEVPTDHRFTFAGIQGDAAPEGSNTFRYRVSYTSSDLDPRQSSTGIDLNFRQDRIRANAEAYFSTPSVNGTIGLSADHQRSFAGPFLTSNPLFIPHFYGQVGVRSSAFSAQATTDGFIAAGKAGYTAQVVVRAHPTEAHTLSLTSSAMRHPYATENSLWFWMQQGYRLPMLADDAVQLPDTFAQAQTYTVDARWTYAPTNNVALSFSGAYRRFLSHTLADYRLTFDSTTTGFQTQTHVRTFLAGQTVQLGAMLRWRWHPSLEQRLTYRYLRTPQVDLAFFNAWAPLPWHRASYMVRFVPLDRLSLYARLTYRSATPWLLFQQAARDSGGLYEDDLPPRWLLDVTVQKRFWKNHLRTSFSLRNVLNERERQHPAGAVSHMVFHVALEMYFGH